MSSVFYVLTGFEFFLYGLFIGPALTDWDDVAISFTSFGLYANIINIPLLLLASNFLMFFYVVKNIKINIFSMFVVLNPFVIMNVFDAYNKFSFLSFFLVMSVYLNANFLKFASMVVAIFTHPVALFSLINLSLKYLKLNSVHFILLVFLAFIGFYNYEVLLDAILVSKGKSFEEYIYRFNDVDFLIGDGRTSINFIDLEDLIGKIILGIVCVPCVIGISFQSIFVALLFGWLYLYLLINRKFIDLLLVIFLIFVLLVSNPNYGSLVRNILPFIFYLLAVEKKYSPKEFAHD